jgi:hypothetical protein
MRIRPLKTLLLIAGMAMLLGVVPVDSAQALGLKVAPLEYKTTLKDKERKQGIIDVSNPAGQAVKLRVSVQGFKQIDDDGGLQFFDDKKLSNAIKPDLTEAELGPREALRMSFTIDGSLLPEGDVYAAIFFTTELTQQTTGVGQLVRVGTILSIVNKTPGERSAEVTGLRLPFVQLSDTVSGSYSIKNTGTGGTGFYPVVTVSAVPGGKPRQQESSLVFSGRERSNDVKYKAGFGIHRVDVTYGKSVKSQWVITIAPWMIVLILFVAVIVGTELLLLKRRHKSAHKKPSKKTPKTTV